MTVFSITNLPSTEVCRQIMSPSHYSPGHPKSEFLISMPRSVQNKPILNGLLLTIETVRYSLSQIYHSILLLIIYKNLFRKYFLFSIPLSIPENTNFDWKCNHFFHLGKPTIPLQIGKYSTTENTWYTKSTTFYV